MKNQSSHQKSIEMHIKSIQTKLGSKPQTILKPLKKETKTFLQSDAQNDSSDISVEDQQHINGSLQFGSRNTQNLTIKSNENKPVKLYQILQLPTAQYKKTQNELDLCSICLQQWEEKESYKILPCTHVLHLNCAKDWLTQKNSCPICKLRVFYH